MKIKTIIIFIILFFTAVIAVAQRIKQSQVPKSVIQAFHKAFDDSKVQFWDREDDGYKARFDLSNVEASAIFGPDGTIRQTQVKLAFESVPKEIIEFVTKVYPNKKIRTVTKVKASNGKVRYEAEVYELDIYFDKDGYFIMRPELLLEQNKLKS